MQKQIIVTNIERYKFDSISTYFNGKKITECYMYMVDQLQKNVGIDSNSSYYYDVDNLEYYKNKDKKKVTPNISFTLKDAGIHNITMEDIGNKKLISVNNHNQFIGAVHKAFECHYPLTLSPDIIWQIILQGFSIHINKNIDKFKNKFISNKDKKIIQINNDELELYSTSNNWENIITSFSEQIKQNIGKTTWSNIVSDFTTTTEISKISSEITLMNICKKIFNYEIETRCGIPEFHLEGTLEDWIKIKNRIENFLNIDPELTWWTNPLIKAIDEFILCFLGEKYNKLF